MLSAGERFLESSRLWETYLALGGSLEPEPDTQSPFRENAPMGDTRAYPTAQRNVAVTWTSLILADATNLPHLVRALDALDAAVIAVPFLEERHLLRGHAVHLRCRRDDVAGLRIDLMSSLRGVAGF